MLAHVAAKSIFVAVCRCETLSWDYYYSRAGLLLAVVRYIGKLLYFVMHPNKNIYGNGCIKMNSWLWVDMSGNDLYRSLYQSPIILSGPFVVCNMRMLYSHWNEELFMKRRRLSPPAQRG